jgi:hypothetical protein
LDINAPTLGAFDDADCLEADRLISGEALSLVITDGNGERKVARALGLPQVAHQLIEARHEGGRLSDIARPPNAHATEQGGLLHRERMAGPDKLAVDCRVGVEPVDHQARQLFLAICQHTAVNGPGPHLLGPA